jgi:hypothetical protein
LLLIGFLFADGASRWRNLQRITSSRSAESPVPAVDPTSPTGYAFGQRRAVLGPSTTDGYQWILQAQQVVNGHGARVHFVNWDNAPAGREAHWNSGLIWWVAGLAWLNHLLTGKPLPLAVEDIAPLALAILLPILLIGLTPLMLWRFGTLPAVAVVGGMILFQPAYATFAVGYLDHHGLVGVCASLGILLLVAGGGGWRRNPVHPQSRTTDSEKFLAAWLPSKRAAQLWFVAAALSGAAALWISAATEVPVLMGIGLAALVTSVGMRAAAATEKPWQPDPTLWRLWGQAGALGSLFFYLLEYFPHLGSLRLEVNHPLYALAWLGAGDLLCRVGSPRSPGRSLLRSTAAAFPSLLAVLGLPLVIWIAGERVFTLADPFLWNLHFDYIEEFQPLFSTLLHTSWTAKVIAACHPFLALIFLVALLLIRIARPWKTLLALAAIPLAIFSGLTLDQNRWLGPACIISVFALAIAIFVALESAKPAQLRGRTLICGVVLAAALLVHPLYWPPSFLQSPLLTSAENSTVLSARSLAWRLRQRLGPEQGVIVGGFTVTSEMIYFGGFRGLGTGYWENDAGLHATAEILGAATDAEALAIIQKHGITHLVDASWDNFATPSVRLLRGLRRSETPTTTGFLNRLEKGEFPTWVRPILAVSDRETALIYEIDRRQTPRQSLVRNARFFAEIGQPKPAKAFLAQALARDANDASALIELASLQSSEPDSAALAATLPRLRTALDRNPDLEAADQITLADVWLAIGDEHAARKSLITAVAMLDERELRRLSARQLRRVLELTRKWNSPLPAGIFRGFRPRPSAQGHAPRGSLSAGIPVQLPDHRRQINRLGVDLPVFGDLPALQHLKAVALEKFRSATAFERHHLPEHRLFARRLKVGEVSVNDLAGPGEPLRLGQEIDVKMRRAPGDGRHFAPGIPQNPPNEIARRPRIAAVTQGRPRKEAEIQEEVVDLLPQRTPRPKQVTLHHAILLKDERRLGLPIRVIGRQVIREEFAILEDRVDCLPEVARFAAQPPHRLAIARFIAANGNTMGKRHGKR